MGTILKVFWYDSAMIWTPASQVTGWHSTTRPTAPGQMQYYSLCENEIELAMFSRMDPWWKAYQAQSMLYCPWLSHNLKKWITIILTCGCRRTEKAFVPAPISASFQWCWRPCHGFRLIVSREIIRVYISFFTDFTIFVWHRGDLLLCYICCETRRGTNTDEVFTYFNIVSCLVIIYYIYFGIVNVIQPLTLCHDNMMAYHSTDSNDCSQLTHYSIVSNSDM